MASADEMTTQEQICQHVTVTVLARPGVVDTGTIQEHLPIDPDLSSDDPGEPAVGHNSGPHVNRARDFGVLGAIAAGGFAGTLAIRVNTGVAEPRVVISLGRYSRSTHQDRSCSVCCSDPARKGASRSLLTPPSCVGVLGSWTTMSRSRGWR